jgi:diguanylate cyclase (GGDEF)-like protein
MTENEERLMSEIARLEAQLALYRELAYHDTLTKLHNRRYFEERLAEELSRADRTLTRVALVMLDLDNFKLINDRQGHNAGDEVLRWVARVLLSERRATDTVCRVGGDELAVLLSATDVYGAEAFIARLRERIDGDATRPHGVRSSIGFAIYPDDASTQTELVTLADASMYADKAERKRRAAA